LGPFLAREDFDVYAADLFGRGLSEPRISRSSRHGQWESITQEIPAYIEMIRSRTRDQGQVWMAHSWGGVLLLSVLARFPEYRKLVRGIVFFATKRSVRVRNRETFVRLDLFWNRAARVLVRLYGYLPALELHIGADNETDLSHAESRKWVIPGPWIDPRDGFDYGAALAGADLPPMLFLTGSGDLCLGHSADVRRLMAELGPRSRAEFRELSRAAGNRHDYGHVDIMTSADAEADHFASVRDWVRSSLLPGK
jgi:pimeloyl-ACP methyl ester carboxylesterase